MIIDVLRARIQLSRLLRRAAAGEEIVITEAGMPVARRHYLAPKELRRPSLATGRLTQAFFEPLPADELAAWQK
jgi:antitoxin (DNA-binding transcriptional repressor) of toxin-antitoxin stability system